MAGGGNGDFPLLAAGGKVGKENEGFLSLLMGKGFRHQGEGETRHSFLGATKNKTSFFHGGLTTPFHITLR